METRRICYGCIVKSTSGVWLISMDFGLNRSNGYIACPLCCTALGSPRKRSPAIPNLTGCFSRFLFPYRIMSFSYAPNKSLRSEAMEIRPASIVRKEHATATKFEKRGIAQKRNVRIAKPPHRKSGTMIFHFFFLWRWSVIFSVVILGHCPSSNSLHWTSVIGTVSLFWIIS